MSLSPEVSSYIASIEDSAAQLTTTLGALRAAAKAMNDLGALASTLQRSAQDVEYASISPELKQFLDGSYIQRTGFVNLRAAEVADRLRLLSRGVMDLMEDGVRAVALADPPPTP